MLYIDNRETDPRRNLALEEYLFFHKTEEIFMLWQNSPSIIIGKSQNAMAEIDYTFVTEKHIPVVRRLSGGGAVYHDLGNLNFTYIVNRNGFGDYVGFTKTLRDFLASQGLSAEVSGRNDVLVDGRKISGNAQYFHHGRLLHHGTILIGADLSILGATLRPDTQKIQSKGVKSVQSRVINLSTILPMDAKTFRRAFGSYILETEKPDVYTLSEKDLAETEKLYSEKYSTFAWNFGYSPKYSFHTKNRFPGGGVEVFLDIRDGVIFDAKIYGDFLADAAPLAKKLCGVHHAADSLRKVLQGETLGTIDEDELLRCFL